MSTSEESGRPAPVLRIAATYPIQYGELPGHPDNVEIELNLPELVDAHDVSLSEFVTAIVSSLFRYGAATPAVAVDQPAAGEPAVSALPFAPTPDTQPAAFQPWSAAGATTGAEAA